jgi:hypothetical protein
MVKFYLAIDLGGRERGRERLREREREKENGELNVRIEQLRNVRKKI